MTSSKRGLIKQILNREKIYNLSDYARKTGKRIGRYVSVPEIKTCLSHMKKEGRIAYQIVNDIHVVGFSLKAVA